MNYKQIESCIKEAFNEVTATDDITIRLKTTFEGLEKSVAKYGDASCKNRLKELKNVCNTILNIAELLNRNRRSEAHKALFDLYFKEESHSLLKTILVKNGYSFYKMRPANCFSQYTIDEGKEGMYHIPFELRHKVGNERYGISGFPVLYLSASVYSCWEETKRANLEFSNVALFKSTQDLLFLDMTPPLERKSIDSSTLLSLPLILASRLTVRHPGEKNVPEYAIPQLVMECLIESRTGGNISENTLVGIKYESIYQKDRGLLFTNEDRSDLFDNYAIPPFSSLVKGICPSIEKLFEFWDNTSWAEIFYKNPYGYCNIKARTHYEESIFGIIEHKLNLIPAGMLTYHTRTKGGTPSGALTI